MTWLAGLGLAMCLSPASEPLWQAHSHNDYAQARPLLQALDLRFGSVEADVFLRDGRLLVGHSPAELREERELVTMYLEPLAAQVARNGGAIYPGVVAHSKHSLVLLVDIKEDGPAVYEALKRALEPFRSMLTRFKSGRLHAGAVTVVLSGDRPKSILAGESSRLAFLDGRPDEQGPNLDDPSLVPLVSGDWTRLFQWRGEGPFPKEQRERLLALVSKHHRVGQKLRFWGTPDDPKVWAELVDAGVDLIGADDLPALAKFLRARQKALTPREAGSPSPIRRR